MIARILIADDNADIRGMLRIYLESKHHQVIEASDGAQAFALAETEVPHLIIMDLVMPGLYGSAAAKKLEEYWRTSAIPIILISGTTDAPIKNLVGANSKIRFLHKPLDLTALDNAISDLLPRGGYTP